MTHRRREVAIAAARAAASIIRDGLARLRASDVIEKAPGDFATKTDRAAEAEIRRILWEAFPSDSILGEEGGAQDGPQSPASGWQWVVDPLDGTYNFVHGFPHCAISIAAICAAGTVEVAVVKNPFNTEFFHAERGQGAFMGDVPMQVGTREFLGDAMVAVVLPSGQHPDFAHVWPRVELVARASGQIRRTGSAALDLAYVAAGRMDAFFVMSLRKWDIAAGALLVTEAGGMVTDLRGGDGYLESEQCVAGNALLVPQLVTILNFAP